MIVVTLTDCPPKLRGDLSKWLMEVNAGVYVGKVSARVREELWKRICENLLHGRATMVFSTNSEQGMDFYVYNTSWTPVDFDGIKLMRRPNSIMIESGQKQNRSKAAVQQMIRQKERSKARENNQGGYVIIDVETTGLNSESDEIIELAGIRIVNHEVTDKIAMLAAEAAAEAAIQYEKLMKRVKDEGICGVSEEEYERRRAAEDIENAVAEEYDEEAEPLRDASPEDIHDDFPAQDASEAKEALPTGRHRRSRKRALVLAAVVCVLGVGMTMAASAKRGYELKLYPLKSTQNTAMRPESGICVLDEAIEIDNAWYYFKNDGKRLTGWLKKDNQYYYLDPAADGRLVANTTKVIDGVSYNFAPNGVCTTNMEVSNAYTPKTSSSENASNSTPESTARNSGNTQDSQRSRVVTAGSHND